MRAINGLEKVADGLRFPEGPAYDGKGNIFCSNCQADYISCLRSDGRLDIPFKANTESDTPFTFHKTNGMIFHKDGSLWVCDFARKAIIRINPNGEQELIADSCEGLPFMGPNDLVFDSHGNLYFSDPEGSGRNNPVGKLYRIEADTRKVTMVADGMAFPNGLAFTADCSTLFVCESQFNRMVRFSVLPDGALGELEEFASLEADGEGDPDGMAIDIRGHLWIAHYGAHSVLELNPEGEIVGRIQMPIDSDQGPTNVEFAGHDLRTMYITDPSTSAMYRISMEFPGLKLFCSP